MTVHVSIRLGELDSVVDERACHSVFSKSWLHSNSISAQKQGRQAGYWRKWTQNLARHDTIAAIAGKALSIAKEAWKLDDNPPPASILVSARHHFDLFDSEILTMLDFFDGV